MPVIQGFGKRESDGREAGRTTIIIGFPHAIKHVAKIDPETGLVAFDAVPDPYQRAFVLPELRGMQQQLQPGSDIRKFYDDAEKMLLDQIEKTPEARKEVVPDETRHVKIDPLLVRAVTPP